MTLADYAGGTDNSVVVTAAASKKLPFSSFLTGKATTVRATAQASFEEGGQYNACLISLRETGVGTAIGGSSVVKAQCGIAALSCDDPAVQIDGSATEETNSIAACGKIDADGLEDVSNEDVQGLEDIHADLEAPTDDTDREYKCTGKGKNKQASLLPGTYDSLVVKCTTRLSRGIFEVGSIVARQHELQSSANEAAMIVLASKLGPSVELSKMESIIRDSIDVKDEQITLGREFRCAMANGRVKEKGNCPPGGVITGYVVVSVTDTYAPTWTAFGIGKEINFSIDRTVQVS